MSENRAPAAPKAPRGDFPRPSTRLIFEERWYRVWEEEGRFQPAGRRRLAPVRHGHPAARTSRDGSTSGTRYGRTIEDILARWKRMRGRRVLWVPGTDHAGIATQMVVERAAREGGASTGATSAARSSSSASGRGSARPRTRSSRSCAGSAARSTGRRERFTMDPDLSRAVRRAFVQLYEEGLIYRGRYVVNWCPRCGTAVSDLEVVHRETEGTLYQIRYDVPGVPDGRRRRHDASRDDARRHGARDPPGRPPHGDAARARRAVLPIVRPRDPDHRGPDPRRPRVRHRHRQGHARARRQRLRVGAAARASPPSSSSARTGR